MKRWAYCLLAILALLVITQSTALTAYDPPHNNDANSIYCGDCHGQALTLFDLSGDPIAPPFWDGVPSADEAYNALCLRCHDGTTAPLATAHAPSSLPDPIRCTTCHHNHEQEQIFVGRFDQSNFFIATGDATSAVYAGGETTITVLNIAATSPSSDWAANLNLLSDKTSWPSGTGRGAQLIPSRSDTSSRWPAFMIKTIAINPQTGGSPVTSGTIVVKGDASAASDFGIFYGQLIRDVMDVSGTSKTVKFFDNQGDNGWVNATGEGICQVCHTATDHYRSTPDAGRDNHNVGAKCSLCHKHNDVGNGGFFPSADHEVDGLIVPVANCDSCHVGDVISGTDTHHNECTLCHFGVAGARLRTVDEILAGGARANLITTMPTGGTVGGIDGGGVCTDCHGGHAADWYFHEVDHTAKGWVTPNTDTSSNTVNCTGCHNAASILTGVHNLGGSGTAQDACDNCHDTNTDNSPLPHNIKGSALGKGNEVADHEDHSVSPANECADCHTTHFDSHNHGTGNQAGAGPLHDLVYSRTNDLAQAAPGTYCGVCHQDQTSTSASLDAWSGILWEHDLDGTKDGTGACTTCHDYSGATTVADGTPPDTTVGSAITSGTNNTCTTCHTPKIQPARHGSHKSTDFKWNSQCSVCHDSSNSLTGVDPVITSVHSNTCTLCHSSAFGGNGTTKIGDNGNGDATKGDTTRPHLSDCLVCHKSGSNESHGLTAGTVGGAHDISSDSSGGYDCTACHTSMTTGTGQLTVHMVTPTAGTVQNDCYRCHVPSLYDAAVADNPAMTAIATATAPATNLTANCEDCHTAKGVYKRHGLTDDGSAGDGIDDGTGGVVWHNNLGSSIGAWADSGGTIPSTQAAGYTGKIDTANALLDDDYNCADCHDAERTSFTSLEAMQLHTYNQGSGTGNCLTCHTFAAVATEITTGIGGTTVNCEDCHSIANGNGPSGEKMYQYDGIRHHKTVNAQAGNCTRCHADPRPADLSAEPGFAGTAAVNDGIIDNDGITWDDGFDDDFGINSVNPIPTQMGCRLCHSNYETYTVDVKAEIDTDWDTSELSDKHGYNKTPPAHGLTIYANNFDARGTSLTYQGITNADEIRGAAQTTQTVLTSHRIDANDGSSKIDVYNYGACFACHTVQVMHASPIPTEDYDTPIPALDQASRNTHPYDTLRYAPGRSVFNDLRDLGAGDAWNNHSKPNFWSSDSGGRGPGVFWVIGNFFHDNIDNYSATTLTAVPVITNVNKLEGFPATATQNISNFDNGPSAPVIDDITIIGAFWTGSTVYVEATSSIGAGQSLSFTYTGAGGPCNTAMIWFGVYRGTCSSASAFSGTDTVTVSNNTTSAPDERTRVLVDLTINPVLPVLSSISLADNNDSDPTPADPGYTNSHSVAVTMSASNFPTHVMFSEDPGFSPNSGWVLFDATVNYSLEDLGPPPSGEGIRTVYAMVKNDAGESGSQSNTIILDTTDPTIQVDTLTAPNGGEIWAVLVSHPVTWNSGDITDTNLKDNPVTLGYSSNGGTSYLWGGYQANDGLFNWTPQVSNISNQGMIKIRADDKAGNRAEDVSDATFWLGNFVTNTLDDNNPGSLRFALNNVEANSPIWFNIPAASLVATNGVAVINVATDLPTITVNGVDIEGSTQTTLQGNTNPNGPEIRINKAGTATTGLTIAGIKGSHNGGNNVAVLVDSGASWTVNEYVGRTIYNITDDSSGTITANTETTVTASLSGGTDNDWDISDTYSISGSGDSVYIFDLQITGFTTGISSSGYDTSMESNFFGFYSDSTGYFVGANTTNAALSGRLPNVYSQNYFACATTGLNLAGSSDAWVNGNTFGMGPDGTPCPNSTGISISTAATYAAIQSNTINSSSTGIYLSNADNTTIDKNIISGGTYGIHLGVSSDDIAITGNQIGIKYNGATWDDLTDPSSRSIWVQSSGVNNVIGGSPRATSDGALGKSNVIDPQGYGIYLTNDAEVYGNFIGTNPEQDETFAGSGGVRVESSGSDSIIGSAAEAGNVITNMSYRGVYLGSTWSDRVKISRNLIYNNGSEAALSDDGIDGVAGALIARPTIFAVTSSSVTVDDVTNGSTVEVYLSDYDGTGTEYGEGKEFMGSAVAGGTSVTVDISGWGTLVATDWVSAIWIQADNDTSPFSANARMPGPAVPTLDWTEEVNYTTDGVELNSAISGSSFEFRVEYTDADNDVPQTIEVWIDEDDSNSYEADEKFAMTVHSGAPAAGRDGNYTNGEMYTFTRNIVLRAGATIDYRFYATDGLSDAIDGPVAGDPTDGPPPGANTFAIVACDSGPAVDVDGTYFEAENFTSTIAASPAIRGDNKLASLQWHRLFVQLWFQHRHATEFRRESV